MCEDKTIGEISHVCRQDNRREKSCVKTRQWER